MLASWRAVRVAALVAFVSALLAPLPGIAAPRSEHDPVATPASPACHELPRVAYFDTSDGHTWFDTQRTHTIVGSEIVKNIGISRYDYEQMTLLDACGQAVTHDPAFYGAAGAATTWELTGFPPCASLPPSDAGWCGQPGTLTGFPTVPSCSVTDTAMQCVWYQYFSTLNFVTDVGGTYVLTVSVAGFHPLNLCIDADTYAGVAPLTGPVCAQEAVDPVLTGQASSDVDVRGSINDSVTLSGINPGGSLDFNLYGPGDSGCSASIYNEVVPVTGSGVYATADQTASLVGTYHWTVAYSGDSNNPQNNAASLPCNSANQSTGVNKIASNTTLASSANPSVHGQLINWTATVAPVGSGPTPQGSVQFRLDGQDLGIPVGVDGTGTATSQMVAPTTRTHHVQAIFLGDGNLLGSASGVLDQVVNRAATEVNLTTTPSPSTAGGRVVVKATVTPVAPGSGTPHGRVQFYLDGVRLGRPVTLHDGAASRTVNNLSPGIHSFSAVYRGRRNFLRSEGASSHTVN